MNTEVLALIEKLKPIARQEGSCDLQPWDIDWGGNVDDAHTGGFESGRIKLAREVLADLGIKY